METKTLLWNSQQESIKGRGNACRCVIVCLVPVLLMAGIGCIVTVSWASVGFNTSSEPTLAHREDTLQVYTVNRLYQSLLQVYQCELPGDYAHTNRLYLVDKNNLTVHEISYEFKSNNITQDFSSPTSGLVNYLYLLPGSKITYQICLGRVSNEHLTGHLYIFDDQTKYNDYQDHPSLGHSLSVYSLELQIGTNNESICTTMVYEVEHNSYYFIVADTPADIFYNFSHTEDIKYYDNSDYQEACYIYENEPCEVVVPGGLFSSAEYVLLAYVEPNNELGTVQNHICVNATRSDTINFIIGACSFFCFVAFAALVGIVLVSVCRRVGRRRGYVSIQATEPPPYDYTTFPKH